ncbi:MarR family transcriptional regulator [Streptosporangium sp. NPDC051023]|uniref:MarR family winged helix-turn-helix transcriptional regulator n=1 Tax=Streptosporangium sp. NPDC051023 TaxID=3155410 RepID=UPI00344CF55A
MSSRPPHENLSLLLSIVAHVTRETQEQRLAELGLGVREHVVLNVIDAGVPTQLAIAAKAGLDKSTLIPVLDRLEGKRLIERHPDPKDRRARVVTMTDAGHRALADSFHTVTATEDDLLADLTPAEQTQFRGFLRRIVEGRMSSTSVPGSCL